MAELHFSDRMEGVSGSAIREIFKIVQKGNVISFAGGNPNPKTFPQEALDVLVLLWAKTAKIYLPLPLN